MKFTGKSLIFASSNNRLYLDQLGHHIRNCKDLLQTITQIENLLTEIETQYHIVSKKTDELHQTCEGLVLEEVSECCFFS